MTDTPRTIRVLIADDQPLQRMGTTMFLTGQPDIEVAGEAGDGGEAVRLARELRPDVVLMDVRMPHLDGIAATRRIVTDRQGSEEAPRVLLLTTFDLDEYVLSGVEAGASGFLTKDAELGDLLSGIRAVAAGDAVIAPSATRRLLRRLAAGHPDPVPLSAEEHAGIGTLTARERMILVAIGEGLTNAEISRRLHLAESTVKSHVGRIFGKIGARDRVHAVILAFRAGLVRV
ncbi:response regulator transcription factor [Streptomyces althioticus]|jgi:DNA-binding NarL/FixJ family response regulator|uniref:Response regulator transcription factor n=2 Tax=Streptomyces althioticus group TaxID=2867194 RepID=A0ABZ1YAG5_9ACTN|nr:MULTISPECIES: response regulator transcription factor [Actinomycetes]ALV51433.1 LuxR family transcriptional regulator [Streptomyces sp. 4F]MCC9686443.1 response regulator transcription factor [Streptomyces sp. MNU103]WTB48519.1 response regulator transcription factor [Streptomyces althioticus]GGT66186.1 DNA-binding response regulator [Streptomyces matensis]KEG41757.1 LuxR family transcriptional regulator [Streptomyces griseorubens]